MLTKLKTFWTKLICGEATYEASEFLKSQPIENFTLTSIDGNLTIIHTGSISLMGIMIRDPKKWVARIDNKFHIFIEPCVFTPTQFTLLRSAFLAQYAKLKEATP